MNSRFTKKYFLGKVKERQLNKNKIMITIAMEYQQKFSQNNQL